MRPRAQAPDIPNANAAPIASGSPSRSPARASSSELVMITDSSGADGHRGRPDARGVHG